MSAETLRRAAALMRERAEAATPGPWSAADEHGLLGPDASPAWCVSRMRPGYRSMSETEGYMYDVAETSINGRYEGAEDGPNAEHIASWHPAVALAVADWLDVVAARYEALVDTFTPGSRAGAVTAAENVTGWTEALAVAVAYLGEQP